MNVLAAIWDGGGTVTPELMVVSDLVRRGHRVRVLADPVLAAPVQEAGATFVPWTRAPHRAHPSDPAVADDTEARTPAAAFKAVRDSLVCGPAAAFAADVREELRREPADVVLPDALILGAAIGARGEGVPVAALAANVMPLPGWGVPPMGPGVRPLGGLLGRARDTLLDRLSHRLWDGGMPAVNAARRAAGLPPLRHVLDHFAELDRLLVLTSPSFEYPTYAPPPNVVLAGPRLDDPIWAADAPWTPPPGDAPLVLVSLSSTEQNQRDLLVRVAWALSGLPVRAVVTTGPNVDPDDVPTAPNVQVVAAAPHATILLDAAAVVTHAGHGTTLKALAYGVPLVCLPMGRDQHENAARVVHAGAGVRLRAGASASRIAEAVTRVLRDDAHGAAARRIGAALEAEDDRDHDRAVLEIEGLAGAAGRPAPTAHRAVAGAGRR